LPLCRPPLSRWRAVARSGSPSEVCARLGAPAAVTSGRVSRRTPCCHGSREVASATWAGPFGSASVGCDGQVGVHGVYRVCLVPIRMHPKARPSRGEASSLSPRGTLACGRSHLPPRRGVAHRFLRSHSLRSVRRCWVRALQPHRRDASRGGKTRSKSWFGWLSPPPSTALDAFAPGPSRDPRSVRSPQLSS
jgi:hypothetical protein